MKCSLCDGVALWQVRGMGYCRPHKAEAYEAERLVNLTAHSDATMRQLLRNPHQPVNVTIYDARRDR